MTDDPKAPLPHDRLVKWVFTRPEAAAVQLRQVLPAAIAANIDWSTLAVQSGSFVDPKLATRHSDVLYSARLGDAREPVLIHVVLEHQSSPDPLMAWRLLLYACRVWERFVREQPGPVERLPLIVPVLLYQGPDGWTQPRCLSDLLDIPAALRGQLSSPIELTFEVDDLGDTVLTDQLGRDGIVALVELTRALLRLAFRPAEITRERVAPLAPLFEQVMDALGIDDVQALWTYVISAFDPNSPLRDILIEATSQEMQQVYATIYDEAVAKGKTQGLSQGTVTGEIKMLLRLLDKRGLSVDAARRQEVESCTDEAQLQDWFDRALTAKSIDEVFGSSTP